MKLSAIAIWIVWPIIAWAAIITALCSLASADTLIVEMNDNQSSLAVFRYGEGNDFVDLQWDGKNNYGACANDEPFAWFVDRENELFDFQVRGNAGWIYPCTAFVSEPNAEILVRWDSLEVLFDSGETLIRPHLGRIIWDPIPGDANLDGVFNSSDLVQVMQRGQYELMGVSHGNWYSGDWNMDRRFTSSDLVEAFVAGHYEQPAAAIASVPEPSDWLLVVLGVCLVAVYAWELKR